MGLSDTDTNLFTSVIKYKNDSSYIDTDKQSREPSPSNELVPSSPTQENNIQEIIVNKLHQKQKRLNDQEIQQLIAGYESGLSMKKLAKYFGCHRVTVSNILKKNKD